MRILSMRPSNGGSSVVARFDLEVAPEVKIFGMLLKRAPDGRLRTYPPNAAGGAAVAYIGGAAIIEINRQAVERYEELQRERSTNVAA